MGAAAFCASVLRLVAITVMSSRPNGGNGFHYSYGVGIRGVVSPYVVGSIDIGFAPGSSALAIGIDYPF